MCVKKLELAALKLSLLLLNNCLKVALTHIHSRLSYLGRCLILNFNMSARCNNFMYECTVCFICNMKKGASKLCTVLYYDVSLFLKCFPLVLGH